MRWRSSRFSSGTPTTPSSRSRFLAEAEITGNLEHPGIVPVYGLGTYGDGRPYYAMRFVKGDSLKEAIEHFHADESLRSDPGRRSLELRKLLRRFTDVCNAIDYAHSRGVLHRDIKPGNIIVGRHGETLVVNWGLAKAVGRDGAGPLAGESPLTPQTFSGLVETQPGSALGTPAFMSPEQAAGELERLGPRSDVYSLGATLYCLLIGRPPFEHDDLGELLRAVRDGRFPPPRAVDPSIDRALEAICRKAMALRPGDRFESARALADDLERWMADEPVMAWREPVTARARRWMRRHRGATQATVAALVAVAIVSTAAALAVNAARGRAEAALVAEKAARAEAQANFDRARRTVNDYLTAVSTSVQLRRDLPGLRKFRAELLRKALAYYRDFLAEHGDDPRLAAEAADAFLRMGNVLRELGSRDEAVAALSQALALRQTLARANSGDGRHREAMAPIHLERGLAWDAMGSAADAEREFTRAIEIDEGLAAARPEALEIYGRLGASLERPRVRAV